MSDEQRTKLTRRGLLGAAGVGAAALTLGTRVPAAASGVSRSAPAVLRQQNVTLKIVVNGTQVSPTDQGVAKDFESKHSGVKVQFIPIQGTDWDQYFAKVLTMIASGTLPDMMYVATEGTQLFAGKNLSVPLDDYVKRDKAELQEYFADVSPVLVESMMYNGSLYQLPAEFNAANMYFDTKLLQDSGQEVPAANWTKDTFATLVKAIAKKPGSAPYGYGWVNRLWGGWMPWIYTNNSNLLQEGHWPGGEWVWSTFYPNDPSVKSRGGGWKWGAPQANAAANQEALEFMVELGKQHLVPSVDEGGGGLMQGFFTGNKIGMSIAGGFWVSGLEQAGMKPGSFDVQFFPAWKSQRHQLGTGGYVLIGKSQNKDLAWEYMKYYVSKPNLEKVFKFNTSTPARRSMMNAARYASTGPRNWQVFYDTLDKHPDTAPIPAPPQANEMTTIFTKYTSLAVNSQKSVKDALDGMQSDLEKLFAQKS